MVNDATRAIRMFVDALDDLGFEYYIGGSMASIVYGKARTTRDVDFVLTVRPGDAERLVKRIAKDFHVDQVAVDRSIAEGDCFNALDLQNIFQVDVFTPLASPWIEEQFSRRRRQVLGGGGDAVEAYLCSPEDVVLNKLHWFRIGNEVSRLQWEDAVGVLVVQQGRLDETYLTRWAASLGLTDLLSRAAIAANSSSSG